MGACLQGLNSSNFKCNYFVLALIKYNYNSLWMIIRGVYHLRVPRAFLVCKELDFLVTDANVFCYMIC